MTEPTPDPFALALRALWDAFAQSDTGKRLIRESIEAAKDAFFADLWSRLQTAEPLHPEKAWDGGKNIVGEPDL